MVIAGDQSSTTEALDATNLGAGWSFRASPPQVRRNANSVLTPDGAIITIGGNGANNFDSPRFEAMRYHPAANTWTELAQGRAARLPLDRAAPARWADRVRRRRRAGRRRRPVRRDRGLLAALPVQGCTAHHHLGAHPGRLRRSVHRRIGRDERHERRAGGARARPPTPIDMHQRLVPLAMSPVSGGYALTAPASANIAPPGYYMLFLVNSDGVPSMARMIRLDAGQADGGPPNVAVSAPAAGASVSSTTPVNANAADNMAVTKVQFTLNSANLGAEDASFPLLQSARTPPPPPTAPTSFTRSSPASAFGKRPPASGTGERQRLRS